MAKDFSLDEDEDQPTGGSLRAKLEDALRQNRQMGEKLHTYEVRETLAKGGFDLVKPEDLKGVDLDKVEAHAREIQEQRRSMKEDILRDVLKRQGYEGEELEDMVSEMAAGRPVAEQDAEDVKRVRSLSRLDSTPVPAVNPEKLHGYEAMVAALESKDARRGR